MATATETDTQLDEALDFEVVCEVEKECENVAAWMAITPCPHHPFLCDQHHNLATTVKHQRVSCAINNCGAVFCLHQVVWRHL